MRIARDYGLGGPGPALVVAIGSDGRVRGTAFLRARPTITGLPDSLAALLRAEREAAFGRVGCTEPVEMDRALACAVRFRGREPNWEAALRMLDAALAGDSVAERAETLARGPAVQPDGTIRIRGCNDCGGVFAEIRQANDVRAWRLGPEAAGRLGRLVDSLVTPATAGRR